MESLEWKLLTVTVLLAIHHVMGERSITLNPSNATVAQGETVIFRCTVTAGPDDDTSYVAWVQNGNPISNNYDVSWKVDSTRYSVISGNVGQEFNLKITNINSLDDGSYKCVVKSDPTIVLASSTTAWLKYKTPPRQEYPECIAPEGVYREGEQVSFICRSGLAVPPVNLTWVDENQLEINTEQRSEGNYEVAELSRTLTKADNGKKFQCNLTHVLVLGERSCVIGPLDVQYPPSEVTIEDTSDGFVDIGGSVSFTCEADANPSITPSGIEWMVPSDIPENSIQRNGGLLTVSEVEGRFNGLSVECVVRNELGEGKTSFVINVRAQSTTSDGETRKLTPTPTYPRRQLPEEEHETPPPKVTLNNILGIEKNFMIALMIGVAFILLCFVLLLILVFGKKRGKTIVVVNSEDNLRKLSSSGTSVNGTKLLLGTPVMDRRNRTPSDNPSDDQSFDSAIHLISPISGDHPDYRGQMVNRSKSNISAASSQSSGPSYIRVPSTELLIDPSSQQRGGGQPRYVVLDMVSQNGQPFPSADPREVPSNYATTGRQTNRQPFLGADPGQVHSTYATTGRQAGRQQVDNRGFETIPLRSVSRDQHEGLYVRQGGQYIPVQQISNPDTPEGHSPVIITVGDGSDSSQEEINAPERIPFLDPRYRPV